MDIGELGCTWISLGGLWIDFDKLEWTLVDLGRLELTLGRLR